MDAHKIAHNLWMGGRPSEEACQKFDVIVLCAEEHQPDLACKTIKAPFDDSSLTPKEAEIAVKAARQVHELRKSKKVLVTCFAGVNRSGLVTAMALVLAGHTAEEAIRRIRKHRKPLVPMRPLSNEHFVETLQRFEKLNNWKNRHDR